MDTKEVLLKMIASAEWDAKYHHEKLIEAQEKLKALSISLENLKKP
jgi:hypothetical protein